ncbi:hypothetical protein JKP88DRAFT_240927 [Tribonema minus]|uniref:Uncharacterized protein n=1 Tax=Tribonema minus TaxID=303371 RepID=A0A836CIC0_9STRA|nr:hypothetical protein JKP88DRAFT_240927 [Tribonema minus]
MTQCALCDHGQVAQGVKVNGVQLSIVCEDCALSEIDEARDKIKMVTKTNALAVVKQKALDSIQHAERSNPMYRSSTPMQLFLAAEITALQKLAKNEALAKTKNATAARDARVTALPISISTIPAALRSEVLGDYCDVVENKHNKPKTSKRSVTTKYAFVKTIKDCMPTVVPALKQNRFGLKHPDALLRFIVGRKIKNCDDATERFVSFQLLVRNCIDRETHRMATYLTPSDTKAAIEAIAGFGPALAEATAKRSQALRTALAKQKPEALGLLDDNACAKRISRYMKYLRYDVQDIVSSLTDFYVTRQDIDTRKARLKAALAEWDLGRRSDSGFCDDYEYGRVDVDPQEVAGVMYIVSSLFEEGGHRAYSEYSHTMEQTFIDQVFDKGASWKDGVRVAMKMMSRVRRRNFRYYDNYYHGGYSSSDALDEDEEYW